MLSNLYGDFIICTVSDTFRIQAYSALCFFIYIPVYSIIISIIKTYSRILRHYYSIFRLIQTFSALRNLRIFKTGGLFKTLSNVDQAYSEPCHRPLCSHIQTYSEPCRRSLRMQKPGILEILEYSKLFRN